MTDLSVDEREAREVAYEEWPLAGAPIQDAFHAGWGAHREYSKQREEKLEEALKPLVDWAATLVPENDVRDGLIAAGRAALAENGDTDA